MTSCANCLWLLQWIVQLVQLVQVAACTRIFFCIFLSQNSPTHIVPRFAIQRDVYSLKVFIFRLHLKHKQCRRLWLNQIASTIYPKWPCSATVTQAIWYQGKSALLWCFLTSYTSLFRQCWSPPSLWRISLGNQFPKIRKLNKSYKMSEKQNLLQACKYSKSEKGKKRSVEFKAKCHFLHDHFSWMFQ